MLPAVPALAQDTGPASGAAAALDAFISDVQSLSARFEQELWTEDNELLETVSGEFALWRPNRFRWHYETAPEQLIVADGDSLWMYDIELEQVTKAPLDDLDTASPAMLLSGEAAVSDSFELVQTYTVDGIDWIKLRPLTGGGDFASVVLGFENDLPRFVEIVDGLEQTTRIEFSEIEVDPSLDPALFEFDPPPGVDVIGSNP